jgi:hypothetical protein
VNRILALTLSCLCLCVLAGAQNTISAPGYQPSGVSYDGASLYVSELSGLRTIFKLNPQTGAVLGSFLAPSPTGLDGRGSPSDMVFDATTGHLFVSDIGNFGAGKVYEIDTAGTVIFSSFTIPFRGGAIASDGANLYVADFDSGKVLVTDHSGNVSNAFSTSLRPAGMVFDPHSNLLWVISEFNKKVSQITTKGNLIRSCDGPRNPGIQGLGAVTLVNSMLYIAEVSDPDPFSPPNIPGTIYIVDPYTLRCEPPLFLTIVLDVKPHSFPNPVNPKSRGVIPAAILTTNSFDATTVDPATVWFGVTGTEINASHWALEDVNEDGRQDLVLQFRTQDTGITCETTLVSVTGKTFSGEAIRGTDSVKVTGCH